MKKLVMFGAGNIGRSFIGQLFSRAGYQTVFIDIDKELIRALNERGGYYTIVKRNGKPDEKIYVTNVRAVDGNDTEGVCSEIQDAAILSTAVGKGAIPHVLPVIAMGIERRLRSGNGGIDIIIAENVRDASSWYRKVIGKELSYVESLDGLVGFVGTSIGKMVPIMTREDRVEDPLQVFAEEYNTLIVDKKGFRNGIPDVPGIKPVKNILAYVDRKLFIHNLGHAATAYLGYKHNPTLPYIYQQIAVPETASLVKTSMMQSAEALHREYPDDLSRSDLEDSIVDLIGRFGNVELRDTVHRVGRDVTRKLGKDDRLVGSMLLAAKYRLPFDNIAAAAAAAFAFKAADEAGELLPNDREFFQDLLPRGVEWVLKNVCDLSPEVAEEQAVYDAIAKRLKK